MIILFKGDDGYRLREALESFAAEHAGGTSTLTRISGREEDAAGQLERAFASDGLFSARKVIILTDAALMPGPKKAFAPALEAGEDVILAAFQDTAGLSAAQRKQAEALAGVASRTHLCNPLSGTERTAWIASFCRQRGRSIAASAAAEVSRRVGSDTWALANELEKLCAYSDADIDDSAVRLLTPAPQIRDEWELSNALGARDKRAALIALWKRLREGAPEQLLLGLLASATRTLLTIGDLSGRGLSAASIARQSGLHPFVVSKHLRGVHAGNDDALHATHLRLALLDRDGKRGRADVVDGLFAVVIGMA